MKTFTVKNLIQCRRRHPRHSIPGGVEASVRFGWPHARGYTCSMPVRDVSSSGLSFELGRSLPGFEVGRSIDEVTVAIGSRRVRADLLLMHISPEPVPGATCGCLVFPLEDADLLGWQAIVREYDVRT